MEIAGLSKHVFPTIQKRNQWRGMDTFILFVVFLGLAGLASSLFFPQTTFELTTFQVGPGLIGISDIYNGFLFFCFCFIFFFYRRLDRKIRKYSWILLFSIFYLCLVGFMLGNPLKDIYADWRRICGLFSGVTLAILFLKSRFDPVQIALVAFGLIPLLLSSVATTTGFGLDYSEMRLGGYALYLSTEVWTPWLPVILCRATLGQINWLFLTPALGGVFLVVPTVGSRALALSAAVSLVGFCCWYMAKQNPKEQKFPANTGANSAPPVLSVPRKSSNVSRIIPTLQKPAKFSMGKRTRLAYRVFLALLVAFLFSAGLATQFSSKRYIGYVNVFSARLSEHTFRSDENIEIRFQEIQEMLDSMNTLDMVLGKGLGALYYFSIADLYWVRWGLYTTPYLPAPHILIGTLMLKGGVFFFLAGGILFPMKVGWAFVSGILRRKKQYLLTIAPYDLGILSYFATLYSSCLYDPMPLLSFSLLISLRLAAGSNAQRFISPIHTSHCL